MSMSEALAPLAQRMDEAPGAADDRPRLVVFGDDWGRHPSSIQHLTHRLLPSYRVDWVNTVGMRRPRFDLTTLRRGADTVLGWTRGTKPACRQASNTIECRPCTAALS